MYDEAGNLANLYSEDVFDKTSGKTLAEHITEIINDLTTGGTDKVLSAEQGKALKALIDTLTESSHSHTNKAVLDGIGKNVSTGNLQFNGKELTGETGIAIGTSLDQANTYTGKLRIIVDDYNSEG